MGTTLRARGELERTDVEVAGGHLNALEVDLILHSHQISLGADLEAGHQLEEDVCNCHHDTKNKSQAR